MTFTLVPDSWRSTRSSTLHLLSQGTLTLLKIVITDVPKGEAITGTATWREETTGNQVSCLPRLRVKAEPKFHAPTD